MTTTLHPQQNGGPDTEYGPTFPSVNGRGMYYESRLLQESGKKSAKQIIKEAEGTLNPRGSKAKKVKTGAKPKNLRASGKSKKRGAFGEAYQPPSGNTGKGVRVSESDFGARVERFGNYIVNSLEG